MIPVDAFAYETLHGVWLTQTLLEEALRSAKVLRTRYPDLDAAIVTAQDALAELYAAAGRTWHEESRRAEDAP